MKAYTVELTKDYGFLQGGKLDCILMSAPYDDPNANENWRRPALIVVPGGGYSMTSKREGEPIATSFLEKGFQTFVLWYLCAPDGAHYPEQLLELASAVDYVRRHADELRVNPEEIFVVGFSAGGHLTADLAVEHQSVSQKAGVSLDSKPTAVGLAYPVISNINGHQGSFDNLLDGYTDEAKEELMKTLSLEKAVSAQTPPAFIWTTAADNCVPADNSIRFAQALADKGIDYELHVYPKGVHGLSTGKLEINPPSDALKRMDRWIADCSEFFHMYIVEKY